jgi:hypothetical protein
MIQMVETLPLPESAPAGSLQGEGDGRTGRKPPLAERQDNVPADEAIQPMANPLPISWPRVLPGL